MSKNKCRPIWLPLYVEKFLADTSGLSPGEGWAYINMLCAMWRSDDGTLPHDEKLLRKIGKVHPPLWQRTWKAIESLFDIDGDRITSTHLQAELGKANAKIVVRRALGKLGGETTQFKKGLVCLARLPKTASNPLIDNKVGGSKSYSQLQLQDKEDSGEGSPSPLPRMGEASGAPDCPTNSLVVESQQRVCREEAVEPSISPKNSAPPENHSKLNQAIANFGDAFRHKNGGCR